MFRPPPALPLFCALVGAGTQLLALVLALLVLGLVSAEATTQRGATLASAVVLYTLTAVVAGYSSGTLYQRLDGGEHRGMTLALTIMAFTAPCLISRIQWRRYHSAGSRI